MNLVKAKLVYLILGGTGGIGSCLSRRLAAEGHQIAADIRLR